MTTQHSESTARADTAGDSLERLRDREAKLREKLSSCKPRQSIWSGFDGCSSSGWHAGSMPTRKSSWGHWCKKRGWTGYWMTPTARGVITTTFRVRYRVVWMRFRIRMTVSASWRHLLGWRRCRNVVKTTLFSCGTSHPGSTP